VHGAIRHFTQGTLDKLEAFASHHGPDKKALLHHGGKRLEWQAVISIGAYEASLTVEQRISCLSS